MSVGGRLEESERPAGPCDMDVARVLCQGCPASLAAVPVFFCVRACSLPVFVLAPMFKRSSSLGLYA